MDLGRHTYITEDSRTIACTKWDADGDRKCADNGTAKTTLQKRMYRKGLHKESCLLKAEKVEGLFLWFHEGRDTVCSQWASAGFTACLGRIAIVWYWSFESHISQEYMSWVIQLVFKNETISNWWSTICISSGVSSYTFAAELILQLIIHCNQKWIKIIVLLSIIKCPVIFSMKSLVIVWKTYSDYKLYGYTSNNNQ